VRTADDLAIANGALTCVAIKSPLPVPC